jgi:D-3-phosphoglycerate dehydrogenase
MAANPIKIAVLDGGYDDYETEKAVLEPIGARITVQPCHGDGEAVVSVASDAQGVLVRETPLPAEVLARLPQLRAIVRYGVGTDHIDLAYAEQAGLQVANVPDYGTEEVSEHALALLLALKRRLFDRDRALRAGTFGDVRPTPMYRTRGTTLGLVGAGRTARAFLTKAAPLGFARILCHSRGDVPPGTERADPDTIAGEADVVSLHAPRTPETENLFGAARLGAMKPTAILINTARGGLVDEVALAEALKAGQLFGAGLDVYDEEPLPDNHPLRDAPNCILTDHVAWYSEAAVADLQRKAAEEMRRALLGEPLHNPVRSGV